MESSNSSFRYDLSLTFTLEKHLKNYAEYEENARRLLESFHIIREKIITSLKPIVAIFPHYSDHSHEHSENVITAIEKVLGEERISRLSPGDTWMLLVCSYMHDIGMIIQWKELVADWPTPGFQAHIQSYKESTDRELRDAALHVTSPNFFNENVSWPAQIYRDVILIASEYYRKKHSERVSNLPYREELKEFLNCVFSSDGHLPLRTQWIVGEICRSHGISFEKMLDILPTVDSILGYTFHPKFVAAMLRLGDLCDLDNNRFNQVAIEALGGLTNSNKIHKYKHESVSSFVIEKDKISVNYDIPNRRIKSEFTSINSNLKTAEEAQNICDLVLLETQNWMKLVESEVNNIKLHWDEFEISEIEALPLSFQYQILVDSKVTVFSKKNLEFSFSKKKAYELITSSSLYNNQFIFVRELVQNSIDALKRQFWMDILSGRWNHLLKHLEKNGQIDYRQLQPFDFLDSSIYDNYMVKIRVNHKEGEKYARFVIEDNGTGISKSDVQNRIINTGYHDSTDDSIFKDMPEWLKPTSAFGIGLHSVFAVTNRIFVETRSEIDGKVHTINMQSGALDGYVFMSVSDEQNVRFCNSLHGTRIEFNIDVNRCSENIKALNEAFSFSDFKSPRPESTLCIGVQDMLKKVLVDPLFTVSCKFNHDVEISYPKFSEGELIHLLFNPKIRNKLFEKTYDSTNYDFSFGLIADSIVIWDRLESVLMIFKLENRIENEPIVSYRGFLVDEAEITQESYLQIKKISYMGGNPQNALNVSRDRLSNKQIEQNKQLFKSAKSHATKIYYELFKIVLNHTTIQSWNQSVLEFMKMWNDDDSIVEKNPTMTIKSFDMFNDYSISVYNEEDLRLLILMHGFCLLIKSRKSGVERVLDKVGWDKIINSLFTDSVKKQKLMTNTDVIAIPRYIRAALKFFSENDGISSHLSDSYWAHRHLYSLFAQLFRDEFNNQIVYDYESLSPIFSASRLPFGNIYVSPLHSRLAYALTKKMIRRDYIKQKEREGVPLTPLDVYLSVPLVNLVYLFINEGVDLLSLRDELSTALSVLPGYHNKYGFIGVQNVMGIFIPSNLSILSDDYTTSLIDYLPTLQSLPCKKIYLNTDNNLTIEFGTYGEGKQLIEFTNESYSEFLVSHLHMNRVPAPVGYESIAVDKNLVYSVSSDTYREESAFCQNYATILWDSFGEILEDYHDRLINGESIDTIIDEIMPSSNTDAKPVTHILRFICQNRVSNMSQNYDVALKEIHRVYRDFIKFVLNCIVIYPCKLKQNTI